MGSVVSVRSPGVACEGERGTADSPSEPAMTGSDYRRSSARSDASLPRSFLFPCVMGAVFALKATQRNGRGRRGASAAGVGFGMGASVPEVGEGPAEMQRHSEEQDVRQHAVLGHEQLVPVDEELRNRDTGAALRCTMDTMPSTFAWLAVDDEQRRRMMEAVDQFRDETTIDDLGVGAIRDAFSDTLFPGTSTLHTRLRYVLFIPWLMQEASKRPTTDEMNTRYHDLERDFTGALERGTSDDEPGIIGRRAGKTLQRVPSVVYGGMLAQWGILERGLTSREYFARVEASRRLDAEAPRTEDGGLGTERIPDGLDPALPAPPDHLLKSADFRLLPGEVEYIQEAITRTNPGTLIARLVQERPTGWTDGDSAPPAPWAPEVLDLLSPRADGELRSLLDLAERFSLHVHGANLLYNLLLAEATSSDPERFRDDRVTHYRDALESWADETASSRPF